MKILVSHFDYKHLCHHKIHFQGVSRSSSGQYACEATNEEGTSVSPKFHLRVKFEPVCTESVARRVLGAAKDEPLHIECKVYEKIPLNLLVLVFHGCPSAKL